MSTPATVARKTTCRSVHAAAPYRSRPQPGRPASERWLRNQRAHLSGTMLARSPAENAITLKDGTAAQAKAPHSQISAAWWPQLRFRISQGHTPSPDASLIGTDPLSDSRPTGRNGETTTARCGPGCSRIERMLVLPRTAIRTRQSARHRRCGRDGASCRSRCSH